MSGLAVPLDDQTAGNPEEFGCKCLPETVTREWGNEQAGENFVVRVVSVTLALGCMGYGMTRFLAALIASLQGLDLNIYKQGFMELQNAVVHLAQDVSPNVQSQVNSNLTAWSDKLGDMIMNVVNGILGSLTNVFVECTMFLLYSLMWLLKPLSNGEQAFLILRTYFMYKSLCNLLLSVLTFVLLSWLGVDLAVVVALLCFFLGFIPEVGAFIALTLPVPLILFDARQTLETRVASLIKVMVGMLGIKFLVSNGLESVLMGRSATLAGQVRREGAAAEETHPVILLFVVVFFGEVWGTIGMLVSVPAVSLFRLLVNLQVEQVEQAEAAEAEVCRGALSS